MWYLLQVEYLDTYAADREKKLSTLVEENFHFYQIIHCKSRTYEL